MRRTPPGAGHQGWRTVLGRLEESRRDCGYSDYLGALALYRLERFHNLRLFPLSSYLSYYPFADDRYRDALDVIAVRCVAYSD